LSITGILLLAACAKPEFWVKGLTLPPGSKVVEKSEQTKGGYPGGKPNQVFTVVFEVPSGFDKVAAHISGSLKAQGFEELDHSKDYTGVEMKDLGKFLKSMKTYEHTGNRQYVMLQSMSGVLDGLDASKLGGGKDIANTYSLIISVGQ
jgi:hypothetical protein